MTEQAPTDPPPRKKLGRPLGSKNKHAPAPVPVVHRRPPPREIGAEVDSAPTRAKRAAREASRAALVVITPQHEAIVEAEAATVWDLKRSVQGIYERLGQELDAPGASVGDRAKLLDVTIRALDLAHRVLLSIHTVEAQLKFEEAVLNEIGQVSSEVRARVVSRLRAIRAF